MRKKLIALFTLAAFLVSMVPSLAFAKEDDRVTVNIYGFSRGSEEVHIFTKGGVAGDMYMVYLNNDDDNLIASGKLESDAAGEAHIKILRAETPAFNKLSKEDVLKVRIGAKGFGGVVGKGQANFVSTASIPERMDLLTKSIEAGKKDQLVTLRFDADYEPGEKDELRFVAFDQDGERLEREKGEAFAINAKDLIKRKDSLEMKVYLTPDDDVAYYKAEFVTKDKIVAELTKELKIAPDYGEAKELVVKYPGDKVALGESVKPEVYILTEKDEKVDVVEESTFNFVGDAVSESDKKDGSFTVSDDKKFIGEKIVVTVVNGPFTQTSTFVVTDKDGNTTVKPEEKPAPKNLTVIMSINSKDLLINGERTQMDVGPLIKQDRTFVPLRALLEAFGAEVDYADKTGEITITLNDDEVVMTVGRSDYTVNGVKKTMDVAPYIVAEAGRTMVPVRFVAQAIGYKVEASFNRDGTTANVVFSNFE